MDNTAHTVKVTRTRDDYVRFSRLATKSMQVQQIYALIVLVVTVLFFITAIDMLTRKGCILKSWYGSPYFWLLFFIQLYAVLLIVLKLFGRRMRSEYVSDNQHFLREKEIRIDEAGIRETSDVSDSWYGWKGVDRLQKTGEYILLFIDKMQAFVIPIRNFPSSEQADRFYDQALAFWKAATGREVH